MLNIPRWLLTVVLLLASNTFMTFAWYYHLRKEWALTQAIIFSWLLAFFEYCLQVPANRYGHTSNDGPFSAPQLKVLQECISLCVFAGFSFFILKERLRGRDALALGLIFAGVLVAMTGKAGAQHTQREHQMHLPHYTRTVEEAELLPLTVAAFAPLHLPLDDLGTGDQGSGSQEELLGKDSELVPSVEGDSNASCVLDSGDAEHKTLPSAASFMLPEGQGVSESDGAVLDADATPLLHRHRV